ncbi:MAG: TlyA family RNA methyltransferase [Kiritimatiellae bacterium]|nr:TlyA family RNA methyltransferase [Verrucomicrobiota bacterium]MBU4286352.1 TlyA family RNA methyltransferase [Verrucomicrobiota bacterium]MBU4366542.1 TlyA family RNA methyltransferase [Verrucomicrobiota bacterium]MCG2659300.1 TlyA family RNA methyltransferase [Kiritimatiellia bacterium]
MKHPRQRLDQLLVTRNLAESRSKAQRLILAGAVRADGQPALKPGQEFPAEAVLTVAAPERFVGRGGEKLERAFEVFALDVRDKVCLDVGASTGGFTDCLLQHGAAKVFAVDVGKGQLHWKLRQDPRVVIMEQVNARYLKPGDLDTAPAFAAVDVSFISLTKVLPAVNTTLCRGAGIITLIKPQFEAGRKEVCRGGVVRNVAVHERVVSKIRAFGQAELGLVWRGVCESPIRGPAGNIEFLACWEKP